MPKSPTHYHLRCPLERHEEYGQCRFHSIHDSRPPFVKTIQFQCRPDHPSGALYGICDAYGLHVWNEVNLIGDTRCNTRHRNGRNPMFSQWWWQVGRQYPLAGDPATTLESRISLLVQRNRNHPSLIVWSLGNNNSNVIHDLPFGWNYVSKPSVMSNRDSIFHQGCRLIEHNWTLLDPFVPMVMASQPHPFDVT